MTETVIGLSMAGMIRSIAVYQSAIECCDGRRSEFIVM